MNSGAFRKNSPKCNQSRSRTFSRNPSTHQRHRQSWIICLQDLPAERRAPFVEAYNQHLQQAQTQAEAQYNQYIAQAQNYAQQYEQGVAQTLLVS